MYKLLAALLCVITISCSTSNQNNYHTDRDGTLTYYDEDNRHILEVQNDTTQCKLFTILDSELFMTCTEFMDVAIHRYGLDNEMLKDAMCGIDSIVFMRGLESFRDMDRLGYTYVQSYRFHDLDSEYNNDVVRRGFIKINRDAINRIDNTGFLLKLTVYHELGHWIGPLHHNKVMRISIMDSMFGEKHDVKEYKEQWELIERDFFMMLQKKLEKKYC